MFKRRSRVGFGVQDNSAPNSSWTARNTSIFFPQGEVIPLSSQTEKTMKLMGISRETRG